MTVELWQLPLLFITGLVAGLVDAVAGGGGLITVPVLLGIGLPPQLALGTNKLQASFGSGSAAFSFISSGAINLRHSASGIAWTTIGAALGAFSVQHMRADALGKVIPFLLLAIALYTLLSPRLGFEDVHPRLSTGPFYLIFGLGLGCYDGFFGPGTGSFWVLALMLGLGYNMKKATGYTKVMNFTSNIVSLSLFMVGGNVLFTAGLVMGAGQFLGARIGSGLVISRGAAFIRPLFITMVLAITARLLYQNYH